MHQNVAIYYAVSGKKRWFYRILTISAMLIIGIISFIMGRETAHPKIVTHTKDRIVRVAQACPKPKPCSSKISEVEYIIWDTERRFPKIRYENIDIPNIR